MKKSDATSSALGFLTVVQHEQHGFFGGYLLLNSSGRPIEFHCTAPVRPNRAQEILYGPTLQPYIYGELIGQSLVQQAGRHAVLICTDCAGVLALQEFVEPPVLLVVDDAQAAPAAAERLRIDGAHSLAPHHRSFSVGRHTVGVVPGRASAEVSIRETLAPMLERLDLTEPFARIREALDEAQRGQR